MNYLSVADISRKWGLSERTVRNYCASGRIAGAFLKGKTWNIPENTTKPARINQKNNMPPTLLQILKEEKKASVKGGIYHKIQVELTYNSNHIEGSRLTREQTRYIYETNTIGIESEAVNVDDILETVNHFRCVDKMIDSAKKPITESMIKELHRILKNGTSDSRRTWFSVGEYKKLPNEVGGHEAAKPEDVPQKMNELLLRYNKIKEKKLEDIIEFHYEFESIHPFPDGNGRVGRLLLFKECLRYDIVPFIIDDITKMYYYRGLSEWKKERGYLIDTCLSAQDKFREYLEYFRIKMN